MLGNRCLFEENWHSPLKSILPGAALVSLVRKGWAQTRNVKLETWS